MVELFVCPGQPGELRLTASSCATNYRRAKHAEPWESVYHCRGCETGARHAGETVAAVQPSRVCRICRKKCSTTKTVHSVLCISCYNRLAEAFKERNAKGRTPQKLAGTRVGDLVVVARDSIMLAGRNGALAWMARNPGRLPTAQRSLF